MTWWTVSLIAGLGLLFFLASYRRGYLWRRVGGTVSLQIEDESSLGIAAEYGSFPKGTWQNRWSARRLLTGLQRIWLMLFVFGATYAFYSYPLWAVRITVVVLITVFLSSIALRTRYLYLGLRNPAKPDPLLEDYDLPSYTVVVALYQEQDVAPQLCQVLSQMDYPKDRLQTLFLCEENDPDTIQACRDNLAEGQSVLVVPPGSPQTKPRALNFALQQATGDLFTIYDAEDRPEPDQLRKAASAFAARDPKIAALQARLDIYNQKESLVSKMFTLEYLQLFGAILPGLAKLNHAMPLGGTSTHFRTPVLRELGGWDSWNVTEDCELGMRITAAGYDSQVLDSTTWEEAVTRVKPWYKQRSRWVKGYAQTSLAMLRYPVRSIRSMGLGRYLSALLVVGGVPAVLLSQLFTWGLVAFYLGGMIRNGYMHQLQPLFQEPLNSISLLGLCFGFLVVIVGNAYSAHKLHRPELVSYALLLPLYMFVASLAAWKGCWQLLRKPSFWEKTQHGGSLGKPTTLLEPEKPKTYNPQGVYAPSVREVLEASQQPRQVQRTMKETGARFSLLLMAIMSGVGLYLWRDQVTGFSDSTAHLMVPARIWENLSVGLDQLGLHWLPLYHVLQLPFSWYGPMLYSGGSAIIVSFVASLLSVYFLYRLARHCGADQWQASVGTLALLGVPSFWFASIIPLHYTLVVATGTASVFYLARWMKFRYSADLALAALWAAFAGLSHFDAWGLLLLEFLVVARSSWFRHRWNGVRGDLMLWTIIAGSGVALFFAMNIWWSGNPVQFLSGFHGSGDVIQQAHRGWAALWDYPLAFWTMGGPVLCIVSGLTVLVFAVRYRAEKDKLVALLMLYPFFFFTVQAASSGSIIEPGDDLGDWRNLRYAVTVMPALCWFSVHWAKTRWAATISCVAIVLAAAPQLAENRVPAQRDAAQETTSTSMALQQAAGWFHAYANEGKIFIPRHSTLQDRFQWISRISSARFIDSNDQSLERYRQMSPAQLQESGVRWIVTLSRDGEMSTPLPRAGVRQDSAPCARFEALSQDRPNVVVLAVWSLGAPCP